MEKNIMKKYFYQARQDEVWRALTEPAEISAWLMTTTDFAATRGARFTMQAKPMGKWDGKICGEVLIADKPDVLSYTWKGNQMKSTTVIKWTLTPQNGGTLLTLEHTGFSGLPDYILGVFHAMGWNRFLKQLDRQIRANGRKKL